MTRATRQTRAAHELLDAASRGVPVSMALITLALRITGDFPIHPLRGKQQVDPCANSPTQPPPPSPWSAS